MAMFAWENLRADCTNTRPKFDLFYLLEVEILLVGAYASTANAFYFFSKTVI